MRQIVLDTETTGLEYKAGHRIIEIGAVELIERKQSGRHFHNYINPQREVPIEAQDIHGISTEQLADKPLFEQLLDEFCEFISGAELLIHNAPFDVGFLDNEFKLVGRPDLTIASMCSVTDTLRMARNKHPGQRVSLTALCKRYDVDDSARDFHGALLDAEILADVYLRMTGGQRALGLGADTEDDGQHTLEHKLVASRKAQAATPLSAKEKAAHFAILNELQQSSKDCLWLSMENAEV